MTFEPPASIGGSFCAQIRTYPLPFEAHQGQRIVINNPKPMAFRQFTASEFARLSSSMQLTLLAISRAQVSSGKAIAATAERKKRHGNA